MSEKHYLKICFGRELTNQEFEEITDIVEDSIGSIIASDEVLEGKEDNMMCYVFEIGMKVEDSNLAPETIDILTYEIDQVVPPKIQWSLDTF
jgi:hypothetical protein